MCSHFEALRAYEDYKKYFDALQPPPPQGKLDMWPRSTGTFIRKPPETDPHDEAMPTREALLGRWGLVPWRLKPDPENIKKAMARSTFNTRIEGVEKNFTFPTRPAIPHIGRQKTIKPRKHWAFGASGGLCWTT